MASYNLLQNSNLHFESPAKVFAKLKSKVQREAMYSKKGDFKGKRVDVREEHGAEFHSPRKKATSVWTNEDLEENGNEVEALSLSPMSSPEKPFDYSYSTISSKLLEETPPVTETVHGRKRRVGAFLDSTAMSHSLSMVNRDVIKNGTPQIRDSSGFIVPRRTPAKPIENSGRIVLDNCAPLNNHLPPADVFSPMRKRKWEQQEFNKVSGITEVKNENIGPPQGRRTSTFIEDHTHNKCIEDFGRVSRCPGDQSKIHHEQMFPPSKAPVEKCWPVFTEGFPTMSPAKMFVYMKERESKKEQLEAHSISRRDLFGDGNSDQSEDTPTSHNMGDMENTASKKAPERVVPANQYTADSADSQSDTDRSEDTLVPAAPSQPILLEDPLLLNSPKFSIPKKCQNEFKPNHWPRHKNIQNEENVIYLKEWFLRKNNEGIFVDGIHREENIPWNSNIVMDRISRTMLKTVSGRVYVLVGRMYMNAASNFPKWFLKKFVNGFPSNWKTLYEKFLSEPRDRGVEKSKEGKRISAKTKPEASSIAHSVKRHRQNSLKMPESCPPPSSCSSTKMSRSGRVIKPPLEYWKGGRVTLDAYMNVTIHESYDTFSSEFSTTESPPVLQKAVRVFLPCSKGRKQSESASSKGASVPMRKVKALHKQDRTKVNTKKSPTKLSDLGVDTLSSPEGWSGRITRSSHRCRYPAADADAIPQKQSEPDESSTQMSKKQPQNNPSTRARRRKVTVTNSPESLSDRDGTSGHLATDDESSSKGRKKVKEVPNKKGGMVHSKSQPDHKRSLKQPSESSDEGSKALKRRTKAVRRGDEAQTKRKETKRTETSPRMEPSLKSTQSRKKHRKKNGSTVIPQDEDEWTEAELKKLQEAVSLYPKHIAGYWAKVAWMVGTRSAEECHKQHTSQETSQAPPIKNKKQKNEKVEVPKLPERPVISARAGTLKRKQQVRQFLEALPGEDVEDAFSSAYMQNKRFEMPTLCDDHDFALSELEPQTPMSSCFPEVKTPQCLHITPGMLGSPNANNDDKYVYQLQKRMKKNQFNVHKSSSASKRFTPTPSVKRQIRRCANTEKDTFVVWEMFPGDDGGLPESGEEEDFYFSDD